MHPSLSCAAVAAVAILAPVGCASSQDAVSVPSALQPPPGQEAFTRLHAAGVQIYQCVAKSDAPGGFAWQLRAPEAVLTDSSGHVVGHHFAGPSWAANDGSTVVGKASASSPSPEAGAIPWVLLTAQSHSGRGMFEQVASVQRVMTVGGMAPITDCGAANEGQSERVSYSATYVFWR